MNTKELVSQDAFNTQLLELDRILDTCKKLFATKHYAKLGEDGIHAIISRSKALGIHPFEALNGGFHCINGKVGMSTELMAALVRKRGHSITQDDRSNNECVILHGKRADNGDTWTCTFTRQDAERAGLWNGPTWKKYPGVMLYNRCMSMLFRQLFPDLSLGAGYVEDELKEIKKVDEYALPVSPCDVTNLDQVKVDTNVTQKITVDRAPDISNLVDNVPKMIIKSQWTELNQLIDQCSPSFQQKIWDRLASMGIQSFAEMDEETFVKMRDACMGNIAKQKNSEIKT